MIYLIEVHNPFQPATSRTTHEVEWREGMTLADVLEAASISSVRHACVIGGLAVPEAMLAGFSVADGTTVVTMPSVAGGGFAKMFAELAIIVAAAALTYGASLTLFGTTIAWTGLSVSQTAAGIIAGGIGIAGNFLVNALMSPKMGGGVDSASFDPTGPKTVASGGTPIPKGYGTCRSGGSIIASYVDAEGQDNYLNVLVSYGFGPGVGITDVRLNNNSITNFKDAVYQVRYGSNSQTPIPYFNRIVNGFPQAVRCNAGDAVVIDGTGTDTQGLEVIVQFPNGVFWSQDDGSLRSLAIAYLVEYSVHGSGVWKTPIIPRTTSDIPRFDSGGTMSYPGWVVVPTDTEFSSGVVYDYDNTLSPTAHTPGDPWTGTQTVTYFNADGSSYTSSISLQGEWQPYDSDLGMELVDDWSAGYVIFTDANQGTLYNTTKIPSLPGAKYDVRVTKYGSAFAGDPIEPREANNDRTGDQVWIHSINEIQYQDLAYPNMVLLGVRALATGQLSGNGLNVTALVQYDIGTTLPAALVSFGHDNPAVVAYDMLVNPLYGGGISPSQIDVPAWAEWAAYCDETVSDGNGGTQKRHVFNGIFDQSGTNLWRSAQRVSMMSNSAIVQMGRNYTVIIDRAVTVPSQIFNSANIIRDSLKDTWLALDDRANKIEVTFPDAARDYRTDEPCSVMLAADIAAGVDVKPTRVQLLGCTNRAQAWHWGYRKLLSTSKLLLTRSFDVGIESVACSVGSVIGIQDDVTEWAAGGRIQGGSTTTSLLVDRSDLTFVTGEGWTVAVQHPVVERGTAVILSVVGVVITTVAALPTGRIVQAVNPSGKEAVVKAYGGSSFTVEDATGFSAGQTITLYDQDVIDIQPVATLSGSTITPANPFVQAPAADCPWVYGQSAGSFPAKLFTVTNIRRKGDFQRTIDTIIYDASVYSDDTPIITQSLGTPDSQAAVSNLTATEQYVLANGQNGGQASIIALGWQNGPNTVATQIWVARNDVNQPLSGEVLQATVQNGQTFSMVVPTGTILQVRAVGVDGRGVTAPFTTAPVVTITVQGSGLAPGNVGAFVGNFQITHTDFSWSAPTGAASYEIRYNSDPNNFDWQTAVLLFAGTGTTWSDTTIRGGMYLIKALTSDTVESVSAAAFSLQSNSSGLNPLGLASNQAIAVSLTSNSTSGSTSSATLGWSTQTLLRADGSTVQLLAGTITWSGMLAPATTYYVYLRLKIADMTLHSALGDPPTVPDTSPNSNTALMAVADGYYQGPAFSFTTPSTGGTGGTGGGSVCPDSREIVVTLERGGIPVGDVKLGEHLLGRDADGADCWKRVVRFAEAEATAWYRVKGYRMSPLHPVWVDGAWRLPYEIGTLDIGPGTRIRIQVEGVDDDDHNFYLVGRGERLLIHNWAPPAMPSPDPC